MGSTYTTLNLSLSMAFYPSLSWDLIKPLLTSSSKLMIAKTRPIKAKKEGCGVVVPPPFVENRLILLVLLSFLLSLDFLLLLINLISHRHPPPEAISPLIGKIRGRFLSVLICLTIPILTSSSDTTCDRLQVTAEKITRCLPYRFLCGRYQGLYP